MEKLAELRALVETAEKEGAAFYGSSESPGLTTESLCTGYQHRHEKLRRS